MAEAQTDLLQGSQALGQASGEARAWVMRLASSARSVANEEHSLAEATRRAENLSRKLAASAARRNSAGVFGPSQAGKSYLVSVLARNPQSRDPLMANFAGKQKNFIAEFFFNDTATTEIYTLSLHDALPICHPGHRRAPQPAVGGRRLRCHRQQ